MYRRSKQSECSAVLKILNNNEAPKFEGEHVLICQQNNCTIDPQDYIHTSDEPEKERVIDVTHDMDMRVIALALEDLSTPPLEIWNIVQREMSERSRFWKGLTDKQVKAKVKNSRSDASGADKFRLIESLSLCMVADTNKLFCSST